MPCGHSQGPAHSSKILAAASVEVCPSRMCHHPQLQRRQHHHMFARHVAIFSTPWRMETAWLLRSLMRLGVAQFAACQSPLTRSFQSVPRWSSVSIALAGCSCELCRAPRWMRRLSSCSHPHLKAQNATIHFDFAAGRRVTRLEFALCSSLQGFSFGLFLFGQGTCA